MKANRNFVGMWKPITFLTLVISCIVTYTSCEPEIIYNNAKVVLLPAENVNATSAVLLVSYNQDLPFKVLLEYNAYLI